MDVNLNENKFPLPVADNVIDKDESHLNENAMRRDAALRCQDSNNNR